jgi:hypothetical protein
MGCEFQSSWKSLQSEFMASKKSICRSHKCTASSISRPWRSSSRVKKARHRRANWVPASTQSRSIREFLVDLIKKLNLSIRRYDAQNTERTYDPHMNEARLGPLFIIMYVAVSTFSEPRSPLTRDGRPHSPAASKKSSNTVAARLFVLARRATI